MSELPVVLVPYQPTWRHQFEAHAARIHGALAGEALQVEHIGSTSVPELAAKPIIDVLLLVAAPEREEAYVPQLVTAGYRLHRREPDFEQHRLLKGLDPPAHIHVFAPEAGEVERLLLFRDLLRQDPEARAKYQAEKLRLAALAWPTTNDYAMAKAPTVERLLTVARARPCGATASCDPSS